MRFIKNWQPITVLPVLINHKQTAYGKDRFIHKTGRLISDIAKIYSLNIDGF